MPAMVVAGCGGERERKRESMRQSVSGREGKRVETQCEGVYVLGAIKSGSQCMPSRATIHVRGHQAQQTAHTQPLPTPTPASCFLPAASLSLPHRVVFCLINFAYALHASGRQGRWVQRGGRGGCGLDRLSQLLRGQQPQSQQHCDSRRETIEFQLWFHNES